MSELKRCVYCEDGFYRDVLGSPCRYNFCPMCGRPLTEPKPLTLDELRQMDDGYIWVEDWSEDLPFKAWGEKRGDRITALIWVDGAGYGTVTKDIGDNYDRKWYSKTWAAYDHPPGGAK